jgi:hypothetical protein
MNEWFKKGYRRHLLDFHIDDWNETFLSRFDHGAIADNLEAADVCAATVFANTHAGKCNYPTKVGAMHQGLKGRDALKEMIDNCHARGMAAIVYYCTIYTDWYWDNHPDCRILDADGRSGKFPIHSRGNPKRFSLCCPNHPGYREFVAAQLEEICSGYDFEGIWPDMTFWPTVCYCPSCRERYDREVGGEMPRTIDWGDPKWVGLQRKRQEWLLDFVKLVNSTIRRFKPEATIAHQSQTYTDDWLFAASVELAANTDWLSADLYRGSREMSFYSKLFYSLSENRPYEHINCWYYPNIHEHVVSRTEESLRCTAFSALANQGAMVFIDAIDPLGTVNPNNYLKAGRVFRELEQYEKYAGGSYCQDVGIYYSFESAFDMAENGRDVLSAGYNFEPGRRSLSATAHPHAAVGLAKAMLWNHIPYGVITKKNLRELGNYRIVALPNAVMLDREEMEAIREYVRAGGCLYASKHTSFLSAEGCRQSDFLLSELLGVSYEGETDEIVTYVAPEEEAGDLFGEFTKQYPVTLQDTQLKVRAHPGAKVLATVSLPYTDPKGTRYASILTNPPGISTEYPSVVLNACGKGKVLYSAGVIESWDYESQRTVLGNLFRLLSPGPFRYETDAPGPVEITMFEQEEQKRFIFNIINFQSELPNIPVGGIRLRIRLEGRKPGKLTVLPGGTELEYGVRQDGIETVLPVLHTFMMLQLTYEQDL